MQAYMRAWYRNGWLLSLARTMVSESSVVDGDTFVVALPPGHVLSADERRMVRLLTRDGGHVGSRVDAALCHAFDGVD